MREWEKNKAKRFQISAAQDRDPNVTHLIGDDLLHRQQPRPPLLVRHPNFSYILHLNLYQRKLGRQLHTDLHALLVHHEHRLDLVRSGSNLDREVIVVAQLLAGGVVGVAKMGELGGNEDGREVFRGKV